MNLSLGAFVKLFNFYTNKLLVLLVDTAADISLIKSQNINEKNQFNSNELKSLSGIGEGTVNSIGSTQLELRVENFAVNFMWYMMIFQYRAMELLGWIF